MMLNISGVRIPDSALAQEVAGLVHGSASSSMFDHSTRVFFFAALMGQKNHIKFEPELLYCASMLHYIGLTSRHCSVVDRYEVCGANVAKNFLDRYGLKSEDVEIVWAAIALHNIGDIARHMHPIISLLSAGFEMDVLWPVHLASIHPKIFDSILQSHPYGHRRLGSSSINSSGCICNRAHEKSIQFANPKVAERSVGFGSVFDVVRNAAW
ncbi:phosphohydrolase [Paraburkholderia caribensis]|uniref:phosphohydrolase n=1 Tax=Paraburkholderia caribensis TaxID=75105 RepID=UPI0034D28095